MGEATNDTWNCRIRGKGLIIECWARIGIPPCKDTKGMVIHQNHLFSVVGDVTVAVA
jgi:hypothetical protein